MTRKLNIALLSLLLSFAFTSAFAQYKPGDDNFTNDRGKEQNSKWRTGKELYPAKPRSMWELGITGGAAFTSGDVNVDFGYGFGGHLRKSLGHFLSVRFEYVYMKTKGMNWRYSTSSGGYVNNTVTPQYVEPRSGSFLANQVLRANANQTTEMALGNKGYNPGDVYFHNFQNTIHDGSIQLVASINNINFYKARNKWDLFAYFGLSGMAYKTYYDALDANGNNYSTLFRDVYNKYSSLNPVNSISDWRAVKNDLKAGMDGKYETRAELRTGDVHRFGKDKLGWTVLPTAIVGAGVGYRLSDRITLGLETRVNITDDDLIDGQRWEETLTLTAQDDKPVYTSLHLNFHLGSKKKRSIPLWWMNPYDNMAEDLANNKRKLQDLDPKKMFKDTDGDGVVDFLDEEPNTRAGCPVDTHGRALDSDKDGVLDCDDAELFSRPGCAVDSRGVCPPEKTLTENDVRNMLNSQPQASGSCKCCWFLPLVHFDCGSDRVKAQYYGDLYQIATVLRKNPTLTVEVLGYGDGNADLGTRRAEAAKRFIVDNYGIDPSRLATRSEAGPGCGVGSRNSSEGFMNRRVEFIANCQ